MDNRVLLELAERCEKANAPDRDLDAAVWWQTEGRFKERDGDLIERFAADPAKALDYWCGAGWRTELTWAFPKQVTASLDAAMSLVPDDYDWIIARTNGGLTIHAEVGNRDQVFGDTPALALCAAALRERAS